jgi:hypothetical protein
MDAKLGILTEIVSAAAGMQKERHNTFDNRTEPPYFEKLVEAATVGPVTEGDPSRALGDEGRRSARFVALEGDDKGRRLWVILANRGVVEAHNAQTRPFSLLSAFFCDRRPSRYHQQWIPIRTPLVVFAVLEPLRFALLPQSLPPLAPTTPPV